MKNFILLLILSSLIVFASCSRAATLMKSKAENVMVQQDVSPPADPGSILNFPGKEDGLKGWLEWLLGAVLFVVYEILVRIKPTSKTYSILGLLYSLLNWLKSDKSKNGTTFTINPG